MAALDDRLSGCPSKQPFCAIIFYVLLRVTKACENRGQLYDDLDVRADVLLQDTRQPLMPEMETCHVVQYTGKEET